MDYYLLVCTPCYGNQLLMGYFHSVLRLQEMCRIHNIKMEIASIGNESLITRARNYFMSLFISQPKYTHMIFIDSDITFDAQSILRMLKSNKKVVGGAYPKKAINWEKIKVMLESKQIEDSNLKFLEHITNDYAINIISHVDEHTNSIQLPIENGFMKVAYLATGFIMIERSVILDMIIKFPDLKYKNDVGSYFHGFNDDHFYTLFDCWIDSKSKRYLSEDYAFCSRWLSMGGEIWLDIFCNLNHTGSYDFKGSFFKQIEKNMRNDQENKIENNENKIEN